MGSKFLYFTGFFILIVLTARSADRCISNPERNEMSAAHVVVTRTIVIDYSPFPDLAGSVDKALIKEGETVALAAEALKTPCPSTQKEVAVPKIKILAEKKILCEGEKGTLTAEGASSYSWNTGEHSESIQISPAFTSTYFVVGANKEGCKNVAYFIQQVEGCHGPHTNTNDLHIFPNPSTGQFFVKVQSQGNNLSLEVYNDLGNMIKEEKIDTGGLEIDLTAEPDGMYLLRLIELGKEIQRKRLYKTQ